MKIIKLVPLSRAIFPNVPKGPMEFSNRESHGATDWFVNVQSGTSRARLANLYKAAEPEKMDLDRVRGSDNKAGARFHRFCKMLQNC